MEKLVSTGCRKLINGGRKATFRGVNLTAWEDENRLGMILMNVKKEMIAA